MELGSIWFGGFRFGVLDCPPGTPEPKEFTRPTPALLTRAVKKRRGVTKGENLRIQVYFRGLHCLVTG